MLHAGNQVRPQASIAVHGQSVCFSDSMTELHTPMNESCHLGHQHFIPRIFEHHRIAHVVDVLGRAPKMDEFLQQPADGCVRSLMLLCEGQEVSLSAVRVALTLSSSALASSLSTTSTCEVYDAQAAGSYTAVCVVLPAP